MYRDTMLHMTGRVKPRSRVIIQKVNRHYHLTIPDSLTHPDSLNSAASDPDLDPKVIINKMSEEIDNLRDDKLELLRFLSEQVDYNNQIYKDKHKLETIVENNMNNHVEQNELIEQIITSNKPESPREKKLSRQASIIPPPLVAISRPNFPSVSASYEGSLRPQGVRKSNSTVENITKNRPIIPELKRSLSTSGREPREISNLRVNFNTNPIIVKFGLFHDQMESDAELKKNLKEEIKKPIINNDRQKSSEQLDKLRTINRKTKEKVPNI